MKAKSIFGSRSALVLAGAGVVFLAFTVATNGAYAAESKVLSEAMGADKGGLGGIIAGLGDKALNYLYYILMGYAIGKNLWDMRNGEYAKNFKEMIIGLALATALMKGIVPAIISIGDTGGSELKTAVDSGK